MRRFSLALMFLLLATAGCSLSTCGSPTAPPAGSPTTQPAAPPSDQVEAEAARDGVFTLLGGAQSTLFAPQQVLLAVGDGVDVDEVGRAILRFADLLTVEVLRDGELVVQELQADGQSAAVTFGQSGGAFLNDFDASALINSRFTVEGNFAVITATGTRFLVVREAGSPLEWVLALEADDDDLTVMAQNDPTPTRPSVMPVETGMARWVAPVGAPGPAIAYDREAVSTWLNRVQEGQPVQEIGEVLWQPADVTATTRGIRRLPQPGERVALGEIGMVLEPVSGDSLRAGIVDCNQDGIDDILMESGRIRFDFRQVTGRVRAVDVTVAAYDQGAGGVFTVYDPAVEAMQSQDFYVEPYAAQVLTARSEQPYHFAELSFKVGCFLGISLSPPTYQPRPAITIP